MQKFPSMSETKLKLGTFVGPPTKQIFMILLSKIAKLNVLKKIAWNAFKNLCSFFRKEKGSKL